MSALLPLLSLLLVVLVVLVAAYLPGYAALRVLGGSPLLSLALAPAIGAALAGAAAVISPLIGLDWSLLPFTLAALVLLGLTALLRRIGVRVPSTVLDEGLRPGAVRGAALWIGGALAVAVVPIAAAAGRADAVLERWDTLYHLSALERIRESGTASSLDLGSVSNTAGAPSTYPAGFHALAALVPGVDVPIVLNGAVLALATVPWVLGTALLARVLFPRLVWAPVAAGLAAILIPASPVNLWIHLSPIPNLTGFAVLPGALAAVAALWEALLPRLLGEQPGTGSGPAVDPPPGRTVLAAAGTAGAAGAGLALLHPNVAVTALILLAVLMTVTSAARWRRRPWLALLPLLAMAPVAVLSYTPLGAGVTGFSGGLEVPWWLALGEVLLGLLTVWPMALSVALAVLWWPGLVSTLRSPRRWVAVAWIVIAVIYLDAAVDSPLNLSALYYRGQDRLAMPLAMLSAVLVVPGLQLLSRLPGRLLGEASGRRPPRPLTAALVLGAVVVTATSIPTRLDNAQKNLAEEYPGRGRFLQADERALFEEHAPAMDADATVLASPFSGASHMYGLYGQQVRFPVAGMTFTDLDRELLYAVEDAATDPEACALLRANDVRYVYQERRPYAIHATSDAVNLGQPDLGRVLFETDHSRMIEIDCEAHETVDH